MSSFYNALKFPTLFIRAKQGGLNGGKFQFVVYIAHKSQGSYSYLLSLYEPVEFLSDIYIPYRLDIYEPLEQNELLNSTVSKIRNREKWELLKTTS